MTSVFSLSPDAVQDTRQDAKEDYEAERIALVTANQELEKKLAKYKAQVREMKSSQQQQQQQPQPEDGNDGLFDVLPWKSHAGSPEPPVETDENLEDSMKKVKPCAHDEIFVRRFLSTDENLSYLLSDCICIFLRLKKMRKH